MHIHVNGTRQWTEVVGAGPPDFQAHAEALMVIPNSRKGTLPGAGHMAPLEAPETFNAVAGEFMDGLPA